MRESVNTREGPDPKNLWGLFPFGQKFDDPLELAGPINYAYDMRDKFVLDPIKTGIELVKDFFAID